MRSKHVVLPFILLLLASVFSRADGLQSTTFLKTGQGNTFSLLGTGIRYHTITWNVLGTVSACSVRVDSSLDGVTWNAGDIISAQACTANGNASTINFIANFARVNMTTFTGTGSVVIAYNVYNNLPSGGGSVTSFSAGSASPLFSTSVAAPTTTPALSFSISSFGAHTFYGNNTGGSATPAAIQPAFTDLSGSAACGQLPALTGDVTSAGGTCATTVAVQANPVQIGNSLVVAVANASVTGTTNNLLAKAQDNAGVANVVNATTGDTTGIQGICVPGITGLACGTTGSAAITVLGIASCAFDGSTTNLDYVVVSTTAAGKCHDAGSGATYPTGVQVLGRVLSTNGGAGTYSMWIGIGDVASVSGQNGGKGTAIQFNGTAAKSIANFNSTTPAAGAGFLNLPIAGSASGNTTSIAVQPAISGNSSTLGTTTGALVSGNCAKFDANGNIIDAGTTCGGGSAQPFTVLFANNGTNATVLNKVARLNECSGTSDATIRNATTSDTGFNACLSGIVSAGAGTSGKATVVVQGPATCVFDGATTAGDLVRLSDTVAGDCQDVGFAHLSSGLILRQIIGIVETTNGGAGSYVVDLVTIALQNTVSANQSLAIMGYAPGSPLPSPINMEQVGGIQGTSPVRTQNGVHLGAQWNTLAGDLYASHTGAETSDIVFDTCGIGGSGCGSALHVINGPFYTDVRTLSASGTGPFILEDRGGNVWNITFTGNAIGSFSRSGFSNIGTVIYARFCQDGTGGRKLTYPTTWVNAGVIPAAANACTYQVLVNTGVDAYESRGPAQFDPVIKTSQAGALSSTVLFHPMADSGHHVTATLDCDSSSAAATVNVTIGWTDPSNTAQTATLASAVLCTTLGSASIGTLDLYFRAKADTDVTYSTAIVNTPTYDLQVFVQSLSQK